MRERAEKEARLFPSIDKTELEGLDVYESGGEAGLYSAFPYESGPIGKNLSTFAWRFPNMTLLQSRFQFRG